MLPALTATAVATSTVIISSDIDDQDGDGIPDNEEGLKDEDGDGIPAFLDEDDGDASLSGVFLPMLATQ